MIFLIITKYSVFKQIYMPDVCGFQINLHVWHLGCAFIQWKSNLIASLIVVGAYIIDSIIGDSRKSSTFPNSRKLGVAFESRAGSMYVDSQIDGKSAGKATSVFDLC